MAQRKGMHNADIPRRALLKALYQAHARLASARRVACRPGCSPCCTDRVGLTSLEARLLADGLKRAGREDLLQRAVGRAAASQAPLAYTFNQLARLCIQQQEAPAEQAPPRGLGQCPLLTEGLCAAYAERPFACRAMVSRRQCRPNGEAVGQAWWFTLDTAFFQLIEHLDAGGAFGLLPQVLARQGGEGPQGLLTCQLLPGLPAPAGHRGRLQQTLEPIFAQLVEGRSLGIWFNLIREQLPRA